MGPSLSLSFNPKTRSEGMMHFDQQRKFKVVSVDPEHTLFCQDENLECQNVFFQTVTLTPRRGDRRDCGTVSLSQTGRDPHPDLPSVFLSA